jgi:hypothetical protein
LEDRLLKHRSGNGVALGDESQEPQITVSELHDREIPRSSSKDYLPG